MPAFRSLQDNSIDVRSTCLTFDYQTKTILGIVQNNREEHKREYDDAVEKYKAAMEKHTQRMSELAKHGVDISTRLSSRAPPKPKHYLEDYDHVIRMLELTTQASIKLDPKTFAQLVLNDWSWSRSFYTTISGYQNLMGDYVDAPSYQGTDAETEVGGMETPTLVIPPSPSELG